MLNINDILNFVNFELNKSQSGSTLSPAEYNTALAWANLEYYKLKYSLPEDYQVGRPDSRITLDITQKIMDDMRMLRVAKGGKNSPSLAIDINGWADIPPDFIHISSIKYNNNGVEILRDDVVADRLSNSIKFPTPANPICCFQNDYIQFYPTNLGFVDFNYLRLPVQPVFNYTIVNDAVVYNANTSIQFEWPLDCYPDLANLVYGYASKNLRDQLSIQMAEKRKIEGI